MILNADGPIAVFAASRESHPYPNALYGQGIIEHFVNEHPATVGEGILAVKNGMLHGAIPIAELLLGDDVDTLKTEHMGLYNLFGDPATRLRYADPLRIPLGAGGVEPGAGFPVDVETPAVAEGTLRATVETRRGALKDSLVSPAAMDRMSATEAFAAMARNNALANDKVVSSVDAPVHGGRARVTMRAPAAAGEYVVKVLVTGSGAAAGHATLKVVATSSAPSR